MSILLRNYRFRLGEIDIVASDGKTLAIVEVRTRASDRFGGAAASVDFRKQIKLKRTAAYLLKRRRDLARMPVRFDVLVARDTASGHPRIEWIRHAFT